MGWLKKFYGGLRSINALGITELSHFRHLSENIEWENEHLPEFRISANSKGFTGDIHQDGSMILSINTTSSNYVQVIDDSIDWRDRYIYVACWLKNKNTSSNDLIGRYDGLQTSVDEKNPGIFDRRSWPIYGKAADMPGGNPIVYSFSEQRIMERVNASDKVIDWLSKYRATDTGDDPLDPQIASFSSGNPEYAQGYKDLMFDTKIGATWPLYTVDPTQAFGSGQEAGAFTYTTDSFGQLTHSYSPIGADKNILIGRLFIWVGKIVPYLGKLCFRSDYSELNHPDLDMEVRTDRNKYEGEIDQGFNGFIFGSPKIR